MRPLWLWVRQEVSPGPHAPWIVLPSYSETLLSYFLLTTLLTPNVWSFCLTPTNPPAVWTQTGCPTAQFSSDPNDPELAETPEV